MHIPTKETLMAAATALLEERGADHITVRALCQRAGVSRQALYNHYGGLVELVRDVLEGELAPAFVGGDTWRTWYLGYENALRALKARERLILNLYHSAYREDLMRMIRQYGHRLVRLGLTACAADLSVTTRERDLNFLAAFYMDAFMGIIGRFLEGGMKEKPEWLGREVYLTLDGHMRATLRRMAAEGQVDN